MENNLCPLQLKTVPVIKIIQVSVTYNSCQRMSLRKKISSKSSLNLRNTFPPECYYELELKGSIFKKK